MINNNTCPKCLMDSTALGFEIIDNDGCNYCKSFSTDLELEYKDINYLLDTIKRGARKKKGKAAMTAVKQRRSNAKRTGFAR